MQTGRLYTAIFLRKADAVFFFLFLFKFLNSDIHDDHQMDHPTDDVNTVHDELLDSENTEDEVIKFVDSRWKSCWR